MRTHTTHHPLGTNAETDFVRQQQSRSQNELQLYDSTDIIFKRTTRGIRAYLAKKFFGGNKTGGTDSVFRGLYVAGQTYQTFEEVVVQAGAAAGTYICTIDNNNNDPATGIGWMQIAPGVTVGMWT